MANFSGFVRLTSGDATALQAAGVQLVRGPRGSAYVPAPTAELLRDLREAKRALVDTAVIRLQNEDPHTRVHDVAEFNRQMSAEMAALAERNGVSAALLEAL